MRVDVSEIKTKRNCSRQWALSSRNYYHIKPRVESPNLRFGSIFHEGLAGLYLSKGDPVKIDEVVDRTVQQLDGDPELQRVMANMLIGYAREVLPEDLKRYEVIDIEHKFHFGLPEYLIGSGEEWAKELEICGSIDMILLDRELGAIVGFEHKSCKNFRTLFYNSMDEQPRTYYIALGRYVEKYNEYHKTDYVNGGIYINEVRKLKTRFEHNRIEPILYSEEECHRFLIGFKKTAEQIYFAPWQNRGKLPPPEPSYLKCSMCDFKDACEHYGYMAPDKEDIRLPLRHYIRFGDHDDHRHRAPEGGRL